MVRKIVVLTLIASLAGCGQWASPSNGPDRPWGIGVANREETRNPPVPPPFVSATTMHCEADAENVEAQWIVCNDKPGLLEVDKRLAAEWRAHAASASKARLITMEEDRQAFFGDLRGCVQDKRCMYDVYNKYLHHQVLPGDSLYPHVMPEPIPMWQRERYSGEWRKHHAAVYRDDRSGGYPYRPAPYQPAVIHRGPTRVPPPGWHAEDRDYDELSQRPNDPRNSCVLKVGLRRAQQLARQCGPGHDGGSECSVLKSCGELEQNGRRGS